MTVSRPVPASADAVDGVASEARDDVFASLAREYYERIFQFLAHQLRDRHEAEDLTQRTFVRAHRAFDRFDRERPFGPWIFTLARRELIDHYRRRRPDTEELHETHATTGRGIEDAAEQRDEAAQLWKLAEQLPPKQKQVLLLHYSESFSLPEVSEIMGITHVHAKVLLFRARKRLRSLWAEQATGVDR